jgi:formylglycine-generating enzyme required for sulfatase activity
VPVGNAGNAPDTRFLQSRGAVGYDYRIGTYEVTNSEYAAFLNAKAASDPLALYNTEMASGFGGIARGGADGSYSYTTIAGRETKPVNFVSWYDAIRFANWLHNGQGAGDTETGAYTLGALHPNGTPVDSASIARQSGARWFLPQEDEWYKAAYHKNEGTTGTYYSFPTRSDTTPTGEAPPGGASSANYLDAVGDLTNAGAYAGSYSAYDTFDQGGNVFEMLETSIGPLERVVRGGAIDFEGSYLWHNRRTSAAESFEDYYLGFRIAAVPEPSSALLTVLACGILWWWRKRPS